MLMGRRSGGGWWWCGLHLECPDYTGTSRVSNNGESQTGEVRSPLWPSNPPMPPSHTVGGLSIRQSTYPAAAMRKAVNPPRTALLARCSSMAMTMAAATAQHLQVQQARCELMVPVVRVRVQLLHGLQGKSGLNN